MEDEGDDDLSTEQFLLGPQSAAQSVMRPTTVKAASNRIGAAKRRRLGRRDRKRLILSSPGDDDDDSTANKSADMKDPNGRSHLSTLTFITLTSCTKSQLLFGHTVHTISRHKHCLFGCHSCNVCGVLNRRTECHIQPSVSVFFGVGFGFLQKVSIFNGEARSDDVGGTESMLPLTARLPATAHLTSETKSSPPSQCCVY